MRRAVAVAMTVIVFAGCTSDATTGRGSPTRVSPARTPTPRPSHCRVVVSAYRLRFAVGPGIPGHVAGEVIRESKVARGAYPVRTPVCGVGRVRTVISRRAHGEAAANTGASGFGRFTIHVWTGDPSWRDTPADLRPLILLHEWYHVVQFSFLDCSRGNDACRPTGRLPLWLLEGSAQYEAERIGGSMGIGGGYAARRATEIGEATLVDRPLQRLGRIRGPEYALAFAAAEFLVARAGEDSLIRFWRLSAKTGAWQAAFLRAFGSSVRRFEVAFERYRDAGFGS
jgi:hypothetical protein